MSNISKGFKRKGLAALIAISMFACTPEKNRQPEKLIEIKVGEVEYLSPIISTIYAGMNSESSFSLVIPGNSGANIYYPKSSEIINYCGKSLGVVSVTPEKIILSPIKKER